METMYDRLGELLNQTLEAGEVRFVSTSALRSGGTDAVPPQETNSHTERQEGNATLHSGAQGEAHTGADLQTAVRGSAQGEAATHAGDHGGSVHTSTEDASTQGLGGSVHREDALHSGAHQEGAHRGSSAHDGAQEGRVHTSRRQGGAAATTPDAPRGHSTGGGQAGFAGGRGGVRGAAGGAHRGGAHQGGFREAGWQESGTAGTQGSGSQAKPYTFAQFAVPRVATLSEEEARSLRLLDLTPAATFEDVKRAYKEKLKYFHPDKYDKNEVLKTVATKKTRMIVEAYELLCKHFAPKA